MVVNSDLAQNFLLYFLDMSVLEASHHVVYHGEEVLAEEYYDVDILGSEKGELLQEL